MLCIKKIGELYCPVVTCDWCGGRIEDAEDGNYEWAVAEHGGEPETGEVVFTHKSCCQAYEEAHCGRSHWYWEPLSVLPVRLGTNLSLKWGKARQTAAVLLEIR